MKVYQLRAKYQDWGGNWRLSYRTGDTFFCKTVAEKAKNEYLSSAGHANDVSCMISEIKIK